MMTAIERPHRNSVRWAERGGSPSRLVLEEQEALALKVHGNGLKVECLSGEVWVTAEGEDRVLAKGETFSTMRRGCLLAILAFRRSEIRVGPVSARDYERAEWRV